MNCQKCKIEIDERDAGREHLSGAAQAHLTACAACRAFVKERLALRRLVGGLERVSAPADFEFRMRARVAAELSAHAEARPRWFNFSPAALSWPLAACLALVAAASLYYQQERSHTAATPNPAAQARAVSPAPQTFVPVSTPEAATNPSVGTQQALASDLMKNSLAGRRRVRPERTAERTSRVAAARADTEDSNSVGVIGVFAKYDASRAQPAAAAAGAPIPLQVAASEQPLKVMLRDTSGEAQTISVDPVSFGSRGVVGRPAATFTKASHSPNQGVW